METVDYFRNLVRIPIVCRSHKFIYFKVCKTAGTSILKHALMPNIKELSIGGTLDENTLSGLSSIKTQKDLDEYFKFVFVRNPWDRMVSNYFFSNYYSGMTLKEFILHVERIVNGSYKSPNLSRLSFYTHVKPQYYHAELDGKLFVDFVGKFENLNDDWDFVCSKIGINQTLPKTNSTVHKNYREYYDEETIDLVAKIYERDVEIFNYEF